MEQHLKETSVYPCRTKPDRKKKKKPAPIPVVKKQEDPVETTNKKMDDGFKWVNSNKTVKENRQASKKAEWARKDALVAELEAKSKKHEEQIKELIIQQDHNVRCRLQLAQMCGVFCGFFKQIDQYLSDPDPLYKWQPLGVFQVQPPVIVDDCKKELPEDDKTDKNSSWYIENEDDGKVSDSFEDQR